VNGNVIDEFPFGLQGNRGVVFRNELIQKMPL
jgi:hypothetical protein